MPALKINQGNSKEEADKYLQRTEQVCEWLINQL